MEPPASPPQALSARAVAPSPPPASSSLPNRAIPSTLLPFYVGIRKGYYKEVGLDIQLVTSEGGGKAMAAVQSGNADAYIGGPEHIAFADLKGGQPINAVVALSNRANSFVCARTGVSVDPSKPFAENIKGKKIAVGTRGATDNSVLLYLLKRDGLDPRTDVVMLEIETSAGRIAAMKNGQADMAMVFEPFISQGVKTGIWQEPFASMPKELGLFSWTTVNLPEKTIKADPELAKAIVAATKKSLELIFADEAEMRAIAAEEFPTLPKDDLDAIMTRRARQRHVAAGWIHAGRGLDEAGKHPHHLRNDQAGRSSQADLRSLVPAISARHRSRLEHRPASQLMMQL